MLSVAGRRVAREEVRDRIDILVKERERLEFLETIAASAGKDSATVRQRDRGAVDRYPRQEAASYRSVSHVSFPPGANSVTANSPTLRRILVVHSRYLSGHASGENRVVDDEIELLREVGYDVRTVVRQVEPDRSRVALAGAIVWGREATEELDVTIRAQAAGRRPFPQSLPGRVSGAAANRAPGGGFRSSSPCTTSGSSASPERSYETPKSAKTASAIIPCGACCTAAIGARGRKAPRSRPRSRSIAC